VPQNEATADFLPNRTGAGNDLIVQTANDWRGNLVSDSHWDQSVTVTTCTLLRRTAYTVEVDYPAHVSGNIEMEWKHVWSDPPATHFRGRHALSKPRVGYPLSAPRC